MDPRTTLERFDVYLDGLGLEFDAVVIGGAALALLGVVTRTTKDCDILHPALSPEVRAAAAAFARVSRASGEPLDDDWLNNGPSSLAALLPVGWEDRTEPAFHGRAVRLRSLGRLDLLRSKLFALCDRAIDLGDCVALAPTEMELDTIAPWLRAQDANPEWPDHVDAIVDDLRRRHGRGV